MQFHQFYLGCLAHASYLIGDGGECAIVDPQRDVDQYIAEAGRRGLKIKYVIETHLHADFVSGHRELAARTGAQVVIGASSGAEFPHRGVCEGDVLTLGSIELRALETPGHTPESICWLVVENGETAKVLTGDTLFIGDVGRPDLAGGRGYTPETMASMLYESLHGKLLALPDEVEVWPAHGAGSSCGRNISKETSSTIGIQRRMNYALRPMPREEFVRMMTTDLPDAPQYFAMDAEINRRGAAALGDLQPLPLAPVEAKSLIDSGAIALDVRDPAMFGAGHIPGAINVGLRGQFASWCGTLLSLDAPIVVIADEEERSREAVMRLARVGLENAAGWIDGGLAAWCSAGFDYAMLPQLDVQELYEQLGTLRVVDVRSVNEYVGGHVPGAQNVPLNVLPRRLSDIEIEPTAVICASGYRSSIAGSILARNGLDALYNVVGGTLAWIRGGLATE